MYYLYASLSYLNSLRLTFLKYINVFAPGPDKQKISIFSLLKEKITKKLFFESGSERREKLDQDPNPDKKKSGITIQTG